MIIDEEDHLQHYGTLRRSGRYPWGSGVSEAKHNSALLNHVDTLRKQGLSNKEISEGLGLSVGELRAEITIANAARTQNNIAQAQKLRDKGMSYAAVAERMGIVDANGKGKESYIRSILADGAADRSNVLMKTADMLQRNVDEKIFLDIGKGTEHYIDVGISRERVTAAVAILKRKGYVDHVVKIPQLGTGKETQVKVLCPPGTTWGDVMRNRDNIKSIEEFSEDGGRTFIKPHEPLSINPKRVGVIFKEDGGDKADGVIYVRPDVKDVSIGENAYAQVRVKVGNGHYLKGMAMYKNDLPEGIDVQFNSDKSKHSVKNKLDAMKPLADDPELPFGSVVRQIVKNPGTSKERVTSAMNIVGMKEGAGEEGAWSTWSRNLSSQMLSKQTPSLAKEQLNMTYERRKNEFDEIMSMTNPTVKKKLLEKFAESTDSAAVHLKAAALPRQATHVILPVNSLKPTEVYAPGFNNGERVVLVRFPHGGRFEIPELTVNNRNQEARRMLGHEAQDAVGIHHSVAKHLSGADFDGDTVLVIPNNSGKVKVSPALESLKNFDPKTAYPPYHGMKTIDGGIYNAHTKSVDFGDRRPKSNKQREMGDVSNLITDMTIKLASHEQIARAAKHSMVVIDAEKHHLDYKRSAIDHGIAALKAEYQGAVRGGASTLISRKKKEDRNVLDRKARPQSEGGPFDKVTGRRMFVESGKTRLDKDGNKVRKLERVNLLDATDDAHTLSSGTPMEKLYGDHSNRLKSLANRARLETLKTGSVHVSDSAKKTYAKEVTRLTSALALAERNAPRERQAQTIANAAVKARRKLNPNLERDEVTKITYQELEKARRRLGAHKEKIVITQEEWNAIQAGAISNSRLEKILANADMDVVRSLASPPVARTMTATKKAAAQQLLNAGYTQAEVAAHLGVSTSTLNTAING